MPAFIPTHFTLIAIAVDRSTGTAGFQDRMEGVLREVVTACSRSDRANTLMFRLTAFHNHYEEIHGFKLLSQCNPNDYDGVFPPGGLTACYDAALDAVESVTGFAKCLTANNCLVNGFVAVITDGLDNQSSIGNTQLKEALQTAEESECLKSFVSVLAGIVHNDPEVADGLKGMFRESGFTQYVELKDASDRTFSRLANQLIEGVMAQTETLGVG